MESSWSYDSRDKGFMLSNGTVSPPDFNSSSKNDFTNWGLKASPYSYDANTTMLSSHSNSVQNQVNLDVGFSDMTRKLTSHESSKNCFSNENAGDRHTIAISGDGKSSSNCEELPLIDLKLGRNAPTKRMKTSSINSQPAFCQVYGCNKDLGNSKDYHKRHKVCDAHSKTAKVIVNGIEQRFCQQCSRFHLLGEFDDAKRSCRRRLAGHNERRRKPRVGLYSDRAGRMLHSYNGFGRTRPNEAALTATSFICQGILPTSTAPSHLDKFGEIDLSKNPKLEDSWVDRQFLQNNYGIRKQSAYSESLNTSALTASVFSENNNFNQYNESCSFFHNSVFDTALTELSNKSGCTHSLLSSQPENLSTGLLSDVVVSDDPFGVSSIDLSNGDNGNDNSFSGGFLHGSECADTVLRFGSGAAIDLLQLSMHQRQAAVSVKQEDDSSFCLRIT